ncbi:hypothetical protein Scel_35540 [Streptomyces cellostaticus]|nr:hypothetical protein Scel_35540 [Streptomyces cellostaticus]
MPERTPYLHAANTPFHKEVRNQPEHRGRTMPNAPPAPPVSCVGGIPDGPLATWENGRIAADRQGRDMGCTTGAHTRGACRGVRYFTGRWYETR